MKRHPPVTICVEQSHHRLGLSLVWSAFELPLEQLRQLVKLDEPRAISVLHPSSETSSGLGGMPALRSPS